jgi:hypothetical protein
MLIDATFAHQSLQGFDEVMRNRPELTVRARL